MESNLGVLRSVEFGAAKLLLDLRVDSQIPAMTTRGGASRCHGVLWTKNIEAVL